MTSTPQLPVDPMHHSEFDEWRERLFAAGLHPTRNPGDRPDGVPSYGWDQDLGAVVEYSEGNRHTVGIRDGELCRLNELGAARREPVVLPPARTDRTRKIA